MLRPYQKIYRRKTRQVNVGNVLIGRDAGSTTTTGGCNVAIGLYAGKCILNQTIQNFTLN